MCAGMRIVISVLHARWGVLRTPHADFGTWRNTLPARTVEWKRCLWFGLSVSHGLGRREPADGACRGWLFAHFWSPPSPPAAAFPVRASRHPRHPSRSLAQNPSHPVCRRRVCRALEADGERGVECARNAVGGSRR